MNPHDQNVDPLLTKPAAAKYIGMSVQTISRLVYEGKLEYVKILASVRIRRSVLDEFLKANTVRRPTEPVPVGRRGRRAGK